MNNGCPMALLQLNESRGVLSAVLPLSKREREFLDRLLDHGEIKPSVLTDDKVWADHVGRHPLLQWKAPNVRRNKNN